MSENEDLKELENLTSNLPEDEEPKIKQNIGNIEKLEAEITELKEALVRKQADYVNFQSRVERDKIDMIFFLTSDIVGKILPTLDDLERIIKATKDEEKNTTLYEGIISCHKNILKNLESINVKPFVSIGQKVDPNLHEVLAQAPGKDGIIIDEFEKGYMLGDKILRVAKVIVGNGN